MNPVIASHITNKAVASQRIHTFEDLFKDETLEKGKLYRTRFSVEGILPEDPTNMIKIQNKKTNVAREPKGALKKDERYVLYFQMYANDITNHLSNQFVRVVVAEPSDDKAASFFPGITCENLVNKKEAREKVQVALRNMSKFNVWLEAAIEITENGYFVIKQTQLNAY